MPEPVVIPVNCPEPPVIVAIAILLTDHVPPAGALVNVVEEP
jgi:hypothetical protein